MAMWEPLTEPARRTIVRAQEVAQMFGSSSIGSQHITFALAESDDALGELLAQTVDRAAIRERLGGASASPTAEMVFTAAAKESIGLAFENARRLGHHVVGTAHLALGVLRSSEPPPLQGDIDPEQLCASLDRLALMLMRASTARPVPEVVEVFVERVKRLFAEVLNGEDPTRAQQFLANDFVEHVPLALAEPPTTGPSQFVARLRALREAFADLRFILEASVAQDELVAARWTMTGHHVKPFLDIEPGGASVWCTGMDFYRFNSDGLIAEQWQEMDLAGLLISLRREPV